MQIITTHKGTDFDAAASVLAAKILYPEAIAVLPKSLNPNVKAFLSIHKDLSLMIKHDIGRLPVVESGRVIGIVTRSDTMRYLYDLLPE